MIKLAGDFQMKNIFFVIVLSLFVFAGANAQENIVKVSVNETGEIIEVQSTTDNLIVQDVIINRGNCVAMGPKGKNLSFGETATYLSYPPPVCTILEIAVKTSKGTVKIDY
jgi:hypothetical protein